MPDYENLGTWTYSGPLDDAGDHLVPANPELVIWNPPSAHDLLIAVREIIVDNPERHDQSRWAGNVFADAQGTLGAIRNLALTPIPDEPMDEASPVCGTTGCTAGWTVFLGDDPRATLTYSQNVMTPDGETCDIGYRARELLGLSREQSDYLFDGDRTREEVIDALDDLINNPDADLDGPREATYTVQVVDEDGDVVWERDCTVDHDHRSPDGHGEIDTALHHAYHAH